MKAKILNNITVLLILMSISFSGKSQQINCPTCIDDTHDDLMTKVSDIDPSVMKGMRNSENGNWFPATGTIHVLIVFAETDCSSCGPSVCDNPDYHIDAKGSWLNGQFPPNVQDPLTGNDIFNQSYFDQALPVGVTPTPGNLTDYYYQMSFGQHIVLGDYYPELITVPCTASNQVAAAVNIINNKTLTNGAFATKTGLTLSDFDEWSEDGAGVIKTNTHNGNIDVIAFVWRNRNYNYTSCSGGLAIWPSQAGYNTIMQDATTSKQTSTGGSWRACDGGTGIFKGEYFHGLFGGNNWHTGNGAGQINFLTYPQNYSMSSYSLVGQLASAYDRHHMGWYGWKTNVGGAKKDNLISTQTTTQNEVSTDFEVSTTFPDGNEFILRDFVTYGDAIRIKLPYINWIATGDVKNQYLWIENHQKISSFDKSAWEPSTCKESWSMGIYAYIQVGKDIKESTSASILYDEVPVNPNGLGSFLFPLTAEGNYDFKYRFDLVGSSPDNCVWGNKYLPIEKSSSETKPNPFTGMSDLFNKVDYNNDGIFGSGDDYQPWTAEIINGQLHFTAYAAGDSKDAFKCDGSCPKKILSLGTNPAPMPVYTYKSNNYVSNSGNTSWENRDIWLNGISIEIIEENIDGNGAVKVKIRFDDYEVTNDVRWCGNIKLSPNYQNPNLSNYALNLMPYKTILIDRGKSPTQHTGVKDADDNFSIGSDGRKIFAQLTVFTILPNAFFHTEINSTIIVDNGSTLTLKAGSAFEINSGAKLIVRNGSTLIIEQDALLNIKAGGQLLIEITGIADVSENLIIEGLLSNAGTVSVAANKKISIEPGAKLIVNGGKFTNNTTNNSLWQGIQVQGNPTLA